MSQRINAVGLPFGAVHIRDTDQQTDYRQVVGQMIGSLRLSVFIATDSFSRRQYCEKIFGSQNVIYFSDPAEEEHPIHCNRNFSSPYQRNSEAILDLLTIDLSNKYYKIPVRSSNGVDTYSGFLDLVEGLMNNSKIPVSLLGETSATASIIKKVTARQSRKL